MHDKDPFSYRTLYGVFLPKWIVDWVLAPFPDESGWVAVIAKWSCVGLVLHVIIDDWLFPGLPLRTAVIPVLTGFCAIVLFLLPWER